MSDGPTSYGSLIYKSLQEKLGLYSAWMFLEPEITVHCARIPQTNTLEKKDFAVQVLKELKDFLLSKSVESKDLEFLDEEIDRFEGTVEVTKLTDKEDSMDENTIDKYAALSYGIEGILSTHVAYSFNQLRKLSQGVYNRTKFLRFYISPEITLGGKVVAEIFEYPQDIPVCRLCIPKRKNPDGGPVSQVVYYFGDKFNQNEWVIVKEIPAQFYVYKFISDTRQEFLLLSPNKMNIGDYIIYGVTTPVKDFKSVSESLKIPTNYPHIFVHSFKDKIIKYADDADFRAKLSHMKVTKSNLFNVPFCMDRDGIQRVLIYPEWFKRLIWSWLLHHNHGVTTKYPMHLCILGEANSGKTSLVNILHKLSLEVSPPFSGVSSTLKDLIPSFRHNHPKIGYLAESNRFSFLDEFLRCITRSNSNQDMIDEQVALMNDLLEHQKRRAGSGNGSVNVNMTSRVLAVTNPVRAIHNVTDLITKHDRSFLSRWLIFWQPDSMVTTARDTPESDLKGHDYKISDTDFISIVDYLQSKKTLVEAVRLQEIFNSPKVLLNEELLDHYTARHRHHLACLADGVVKTRCLFEHSVDFRAKEEDYVVVEEVWANVIKSWIDSEDLDKIAVERRHFYLPEVAQFAYKVLCRENRPVSRWETEEILCKDLSKSEYVTAVAILLKVGLLIQDNEFIKPWWMKPEDGVDE